MADIAWPRLRTAARFLCGLSVLIALSAGATQAQAPNVGEPAASSADLAALPHDLSPWGMFVSADPLVKAVLIGLAFASVVTWTVWLAKTIELIMARRRVRVDLATLGAARRLADGVERINARQSPAGAFL